MVKILVWVPVEYSFGYELHVEDPEDLNEIEKRLLEKDPSDWHFEPDFYGGLHDAIKYSVDSHKIEREMIEVQDGLEDFINEALDELDMTNSDLMGWCDPEPGHFGFGGPVIESLAKKHGITKEMLYEHMMSNQ